MKKKKKGEEVKEKNNNNKNIKNCPSMKGGENTLEMFPFYFRSK